MASWIQQASDFADWAHYGQTYGNNLPYQEHLTDVSNVLEQFNFRDYDIQTAAILHDVVEDTGIPPQFIEDCFGPRVACLVWAVSGFGNRKEQQAQIKEKILEYPDAAVLKLADRIANVSFGLENPGKHLQRYFDEMQEFSYIQPLVPKVMWDHLVNLFEIAYSKGLIYD